jgi:PKHD-type hydroxylase
MSIQLSEPEDYEGGEFQFDFRNSEDGSPNIKTVSELKEKGSILVFPSHLYHRVLPIKKGKRLSLVVWTLGQPFR